MCTHRLRAPHIVGSEAEFCVLGFRIFRFIWAFDWSLRKPTDCRLRQAEPPSYAGSGPALHLNDLSIGREHGQPDHATPSCEGENMAETEPRCTAILLNLTRISHRTYQRRTKSAERAVDIRSGRKWTQRRPTPTSAPAEKDLISSSCARNSQPSQFIV